MTQPDPLTLDLLSPKHLPDGWVYPAAFLRLLEGGLNVATPWWILRGDLLRATAAGLKRRCPARNLVPFARREDNDDVACWDAATTSVHIIHDFASPGWEERDAIPDLYSWIRLAIEEMIEHDCFEDGDG